MKINHNIPALKTLNHLNKVNSRSATAMERLSSGMRINSSADDAAGMAIANKMDAQIRGLKQANRNSMDGISLIQTAEGALNESHAILQRMRELAVQAANGTYSDTDRQEIQKEVNQLTSEINRIAETSEFNTKPLLKGGDTKETGLDGLNELVFAGGEDTTPTAATSEWVVPDLSDDTVVAALVGKKITIGNTTITLEQDDVRELLDKTNDERQAELGKQIQEKLNVAIPESDVKVEEVKKAGSVVTVTFSAKTEGEDGNKLTIKDGKETMQAVQLQVGANANQVLVVEIGDMRADKLGLVGKPGTEGFSKENNVTDGIGQNAVQAALDYTDTANAEKAIEVVNTAIGLISTQRASLGAYQNRLEHTVSNLAVSEENMTSALSRIADADMAEEMANYTKDNVVSQAAMAMLAQANQRPQQILQLLQR